MSQRHRVSAAPTGAPRGPGRLGGGEAAVLVTVQVLTGVLALAGIPVPEIVQLLSWAGVIGVALITGAGTGLLGGIGRAVGALFSQANQR